MTRLALTLRAIALCFALCLAHCVALASPAGAHRTGDAQLRLDIEADRVTGEFALALRDVEGAVGVDVNGDGRIEWGELRARRAVLASHLGQRIGLATESGDCPLAFEELGVRRDAGDVFAVLAFRARCAAVISQLSVRYDVLFDRDAGHRALLAVRSGELSQGSVFSPTRRSVSLRTGGSFLAAAVDFFLEGVRHLAIGADHILFLVVLLLPSVLRRDAAGWTVGDDLPRVALDVAKVVTAFTAAHSLTLGAVAFAWIAPPVRWVEVAIAASIVVAAAHNLGPRFRVRPWLLALPFGLVHGMGFAGVLAELGLPAAHRAVAVVAFNAGIEAGQLALVALLLPCIYALRSWSRYPQLVVGAGSAAIAGVGFVWLLERLSGEAWIAWL